MISSLYAYYYVVTILASPEEYDAYARNWRFQLLMFVLFRLPWLVLALVVLVAGIVVLPIQTKSPVQREMSGT
jgi:cell division septal protein FtsQ